MDETNQRLQRGFTLIELSIVLVIIGLIIGGVLVGQDLIGAAAVRAQISQIEKYNTAVNTFKIKYGYIPGDIPDPYASQFGFHARGGNPGEGDGNGQLQDYFGYVTSVGGSGGEAAMFWVDLSAAGFVDGQFNTATPTANEGGPNDITGAAIAAWLPSAKIGNGNYVFIWSGGIAANSVVNGDGLNYFGLAAIQDIGFGYRSGTALSIQQAYNIDKKIDDGLPQSGQVMALTPNRNTGIGVAWAAGNNAVGALPGTAASGSSTTCFDNGGNASAPMQYSMEISNGSGPNCALSFKMQGAAR